MTRAIPTPRRPLVLALLLVGAGCRAERADEDWQGTMETLPNGAVRVTNPATGIWNHEASWRLVQEVSIGAVDGSEAEVFGGVAYIEVGSEGRIYVVDRVANEVRVFAPDGSHLFSAGRHGQGPGEFTNANGLEWLTEDSLVVVDQRGNRYSILDRDGGFVRSVPRRLGFYGWAYGGGLVDGWIYEQSSVGGRDDYVPALLGTNLRPPPDPAGPTSGSDSPPGGQAAEASGDTIVLPPTEASAYEAFSVRNPRGGMMMAVPFTPSAHYHLDRDGKLWHGHGGDLRIFRSSLEGDTLAEILIDADPAPVTPGEMAEWEGSDAVRRFREMGGELDLGRVPSTKPFFDGIYRDPDGYLWLSTPAGPEAMAFRILDPDGRYLGRLGFPGIARDTYVVPVVRRGRLYVVGRDALDVQHVYGFRIEKPGR